MSRVLKSLGGFGILCLLLLIASGAAHAATITFNFDVCGASTNTGLSNVQCGATSTYTVGGFTITATADPAASNNLLYAKNGGSGEQGLDLTSDPSMQNEITPGHFIQLDVSSIIGNDPLTIIMNSTTSGEAWKVVENTVANTMAGGMTEATGTNELAFTINPGDKYLDITETTEGGNILLSSLSFTTATTPEPSSLVLLGSGILGLAGAVRRKLKA